MSKRWFAFGLLSSVAGIQAIQRDAAKAIAKAAGAKASTDANLRAVLAMLGHQATEAAVRSSRATAQQTTALPELLTRAGETGPGASVRELTSLVTGEKPPEMSGLEWWAKRAGMFLVGGVGILAVLWLYTGGPARLLARRARAKAAA